jgi:hypothetical protein
MIMSEFQRASTNGERANVRMRKASVQAFDACASVQRRATQILEELDEITSPHGVPITELHDEDSAVIAVDEARHAHEAVAKVAG